MAVEALSCTICSFSYNDTTNRPKILPCSHTYCLKCLKFMYNTDGRIVCPACSKIYFEEFEMSRDNLTLLGLLEDMNLFCRPHETRADQFCCDHFAPVCEECKAHATCKVLEIVENHREIAHIVTEDIKKQEAKLQENGVKLPPTLTNKIKGRFKLALKENVDTCIQLRSELKSLFSLNCNLCKNKGLFLQKADFLVICKACLTANFDQEDLINLEEEEQAKQEVTAKIRRDLAEVNVDCLNPIISGDLCQLEQISLFKSIKIGATVVNLKSRRKEWVELVDEICCPKCCTLTSKAKSTFYVLPCSRALHVICEQCANSCKMMPSITCPLDHQNFAATINLLTVHRPQQVYPEANGYQQFNQPYQNPMGYQVPYQQYQDPMGYQTQYQFVQPPFQGAFQDPYLMPGQFPNVHGYPEQQVYPGQFHFPPMPLQMPPPMPLQMPPPMPPPLNVQAPPPRKPIAPAPPRLRVENEGTPLPAFVSQSSEYVLDRFNTVLPLVGMPASQYTNNNKGWNLQVGKNQVEAVVLTCSSKVFLTGIALANPVVMGAVATLKYVKMYLGPSVRGRPIFEQTCSHDLVGGNEIMTYHALSTPIEILSRREYSLKLKIAMPAGVTQPVMLYRGNSFDRPDVWIGSDNSVWDFAEQKEFEEDEFPNGQNNFTGPILRFIYTH